MIAFLTGKVIEAEPAFVVIETHGIGYQIHISLHTFAEIKGKEQVHLFTYLHVREDAHVLYGFSRPVEKSMFQSLIGVNGIGPNTAMVILSCLSTAELYLAIVAENVDVLQSVKGIGKKSAQRIILELKDKLKKDPMERGAEEIIGKTHNTTQDEALRALTTLGLSKGVAEKSISAVLEKHQGDISLEQLVKLALKGA